MNNEVYLVPKDELYHYGVKGMKWGHRKAHYTSEAGQRYADAKAKYKSAKKAYSKSFDSAYGYSQRHYIGQFINKKTKAESDRRWNDAYKKVKASDKAKKKYKDAKKEYKQSDEYKVKREKALKVGAAVAGTALAAYGAYKLNEYVKNENTRLMTIKGHEAAEEYLNRHHSGSISISTFKDGSASVGRSINGRYEDSGRMSGERARNLYDHFREMDDIATETARGIRYEYADKARNAKFKDAAKNVINDRTNTYKQNANAKRAVKDAAAAKLKEQQDEYLRRMRAGAQQRNTRRY